jgi:hypothetical protein
MEKVIVEIDPHAKVTVSVEGVSGSGCHALSKAIEGALGRTTEDVRTVEYYQEERVDARNARHHG